MRVRARAHTPTCTYHPSVCRQAPSEREREKNENANVRALATFFTHTFLVTRHSFLATIRQTWAALPKTSATFTIAEPKRKAGGRAVRSSCCRWTRSTMSWTVRGKKQALFFFRSHLAKQQPLSLVLSRFPRFTYTPYTHTHTHTHTHTGVQNVVDLCAAPGSWSQVTGDGVLFSCRRPAPLSTPTPLIIISQFSALPFQVLSRRLYLPAIREGR